MSTKPNNQTRIQNLETEVDRLRRSVAALQAQGTGRDPLDLRFCRISEPSGVGSSPTIGGNTPPADGLFVDPLHVTPGHPAVARSSANTHELADLAGNRFYGPATWHAQRQGGLWFQIPHLAPEDIAEGDLSTQATFSAGDGTYWNGFNLGAAWLRNIETATPTIPGGGKTFGGGHGSNTSLKASRRGQYLVLYWFGVWADRAATSGNEIRIEYGVQPTTKAAFVCGKVSIPGGNTAPVASTGDLFAHLSGHGFYVWEPGPTLPEYLQFWFDIARQDSNDDVAIVNFQICVLELAVDHTLELNNGDPFVGPEVGAPP